jgi:hypothetical protein
VSERQLKDLEKQLRVRLPADYRRFLFAQNGGRPERGYFPVEGRDRLTWIDFFYSLDDHLVEPTPTAVYQTLAFAQHRFGRIIPSGSIAIASVARDDPLLLFCSGPRRGQIYLKRLEDLPFPPRGRWEKEPELGLRFIAPSFAAFWALLQDDPSGELLPGGRPIVIAKPAKKPKTQTGRKRSHRHRE